MNELNEHLPIDMENRDVLIEKFNSIKDLGASYLHAQNKISSSARVPSEDASPEEWSEFHSKMGVPDSVDDYGLPDELPEDSLLTRMKDIAHNNKVTLKQWESMANEIVKNEQEQSIARAQQKTESIDNWKRQAAQVYGDDMEHKSAMAERALNQFVGQNQDLKQVLEETGMGHHPAVMDFMVQLGEQMSDDTTPGIDTGSSSLGENAQKLAERGRKLALMRSLRDSRDPDHEEVLREFMDIQQKLEAAGYEGVTDPNLQSKWSI